MKVFAVTLMLFLVSLSSCDLFHLKGDLPDLSPLTSNEELVVGSNNNFACNIFKATCQEDTGNVFISPLSIGIALGMTYNGASGKAAEDMRNLLGFNDIANGDLNAAYKSIVDRILGMDNNVDLFLANSIWYSQIYTVKDTFAWLVEKYYHAEIRSMDVLDPNTKNVINNWISDKTHDKINDVLDIIDPDVVMFLINAIYFKADWTYEFNKKLTYDGIFYLEDGSAKSCKMMKGENIELFSLVNDTLQFIDIPYGNGQFSLTILLPSEDKKTSDILSMLTSSYFQHLADDAHQIKLMLEMPKFRLEYKKDLKELLHSLGMPAAGYTNMVDDAELIISRVIHQTFINVDEAGTEAAAATVVEGKNTAMPISVISVNRPFIFFIREKYTKTILFSGVLRDIP